MMQRMWRSRKLVLALVLLVLLLDGAWRVAVLSSQNLPYATAVERLKRLIPWHPAPLLAWQTLADRGWDYVQAERSLSAIEIVWGDTRTVWLQTGRDQDRARAGWLAVMLQNPVANEPQ